MSSILGVGASAAVDGLAGGAESAFSDALGAAGGGNQQLEQQMLEQGLMTIMEPMLMNMAAHTQKIIKGDSSGMM